MQSDSVLGRESVMSSRFSGANTSKFSEKHSIYTTQNCDVMETLAQLDSLVAFFLEHCPKVFRAVCIKRFGNFGKSLAKLKNNKQFLELVFEIIDRDVETTQKVMRYEIEAKKQASPGLKPKGTLLNPD